MEINFLHRNPHLDDMEKDALSIKSEKDVSDLLNVMLYWESKQEEEIFKNVKSEPITQKLSEKEEALRLLNQIKERDG